MKIIHVPLEKDIASLGTRFDQIASIKIRGLLEEPRKDLNYLLDFHGSLFGNESSKGGNSGGSGGAFGKKPSKAGPSHTSANMYREGTEQHRLHAMMDLLHAHDGKEYAIRDSDDSTQGSSVAKNSRLFQERRTPNLVKDGKKVIAQSQPVADRDKDYVRQPIPQNLQPVSQPQMNPSRPSQIPVPVVKNPFAGLGPITPDLIVDPDRMSFQISASGVAAGSLASASTIFDGNLMPVYSDVELDIIEKLRSVVSVTDAADQQGTGNLREQAKYLANYVPVLYSHQNNLTFASKCFTDPEGEIIHSFNVYMTLDDSRGDQAANPSCVFLDSGEEVYWSPSRITQFMVMERESDQCSVLCVASEDCNIKFIPFQQNPNSSKVIEFLDGISSCQLTNDSPTTLKRYGRSDLVVCTTSGGDILVIDSLQGEVLYNDKQCEGSISSACFVQENSFFLIGSGSNDAIKHDNSLTFLSVNSPKLKEEFEGIKPPTFKYKVRVKKAHGDTFGVICVAADNSSKVSPIVFSAGGKDDPCIKVWNFESKELIKTIETKEGIHHLALQLIVTRAASDSPSFLDKTGKGEIKGAWKNRAEEITNFQKMRDENKKRKIGGKITELLPHGTLSFVLVDVTNKGLRAYKINVLPGSKQPPTTKDIGLSFEIKSRLSGFAFGLSQLTKLSDECFLVQLAAPTQKIDLFTLKLASA